MSARTWLLPAMEKPWREAFGNLRLARAEARLWSNAPSTDHVAELMAWFCLGELQSWPYHHGPTCRETREANLGPALAHACRTGYITTGSQPGEDPDEQGWEQRAAVDGQATDAVLDQLRGLTAGTRLQVIAHRPARRRRDYEPALVVTRAGDYEFTEFGAQLTRRDARDMFRGVPDHVADELAEMWQVTIIDPRWGAHRLLWDRLAEPDWDRPSPPRQETDVPAPLPQSQRTHGWDGKPLTDAGKRFFALRESGYRGWIDQDGHAVSDAEHERLLDQVRTSTSASTSTFDPPPAAKPYTRPPTSTPGATMSASIQEIRGVLAGASDAISDSQGPIQRAIDEAIQARAALMAAMDGSNQADVDAQIATLTAMIDDLEAALGRSHQAITGNQQIGARL